MKYYKELTQEQRDIAIHKIQVQNPLQTIGLPLFDSINMSSSKELNDFLLSSRSYIFDKNMNCYVNLTREESNEHISN